MSRFPLFDALSKAKKYTPLDPTIFRMMMKAGIGVDPHDIRGTAPLPMGRLSARGLNPPLRTGPLEFGGPRPTAPPAKIRGRTMEQALASNKAHRERPRIPTGLSAQAKAKREAQEKSRHRS